MVCGKRMHLMKRFVILCGVLVLLAMLTLQGSAYACPA